MKSTMNGQKDLLRALIDLLDGIVEVFLTGIIEPLLGLHTKFDHSVGQILSKILQSQKQKIPGWVLKEGTVTYGRIGLVFPTIVLLSWGHSLLPAVLVFVVYAASFWERAMPDFCSDDNIHSDKGDESGNTHGEEESFEVVSTGSSHSMPSWARMHRARVFTSFASGMVDRAFTITCWISLLHRISSTGKLHMAQYLTMISLIVMEGANGCLSFYKFFTTLLISPPHTEDIDFAKSVIDVVRLRKIKQSFEFLGMTLFMLPLTRYLGLLLVVFALPMEYELGREQARKRVLYYSETGKSFDHRTLKGWMQMKSLASKLVLGVSRRDAMDMVMNACASNTVDEVIVEAPAKVDLLFIEKQGIDFVITSPTQNNVVTDEVVNANRVLILGEHGHLRRVEPKPALHKD